MGRLKDRIPRNASRKAGMRMVTVGVPATILLALAASALIRWGLDYLIGGLW